MPTEPAPITLAQIVRRAAEAVDPDSVDAEVADFEAAFEDADEPASAVLEDLDERIELAARRVDPEGEKAPVVLMSAVVKHLARKRGEVAGDPVEILRHAARDEFDGAPPPVVEELLNDLGISV